MDIQKYLPLSQLSNWQKLCFFGILVYPLEVGKREKERKRKRKKELIAVFKITKTFLSIFVEKSG